MVPVYQKPSIKRRSKRPGAKAGHPGRRRKTPPQANARAEHRLACCPDCGGALCRRRRVRTRVIEDIPEGVTPVVTEHKVHRDYCPACQKDVEPVVPDALPHATLGHRVVALSAYLHYGLGVTISNLRDVLGSCLATVVISAGGLMDAWRRLGRALLPWYLQIAQEARNSAVLQADETGWRVGGQVRWLWCFCNHHCCYYMVDRSRGSPALQQFFTEAFAGTLVHDFWRPYEAVCAEEHQYCLPHLLRELVKVDEQNHSVEWKAFSKQLKRLVRDGIRLAKRPDFNPADPGRYRSRVRLIHQRLCALADATYHDPDAQRLADRISRHRDHLFTFLDTPGVPHDNNHAERQIRPAVIIRKNSLCNRSQQGADTQAVLMSIFRTLKLRGHDAVPTIVRALRQWLTTGQLPPLPPPAAARG